MRVIHTVHGRGPAALDELFPHEITHATLATVSISLRESPGRQSVLVVCDWAQFVPFARAHATEARRAGLSPSVGIRRAIRHMRQDEAMIEQFADAVRGERPALTDLLASADPSVRSAALHITTSLLRDAPSRADPSATRA